MWKCQRNIAILLHGWAVWLCWTVLLVSKNHLWLGPNSQDSACSEVRSKNAVLYVHLHLLFNWQFSLCRLQACVYTKLRSYVCSQVCGHYIHLRLVPSPLRLPRVHLASTWHHSRDEWDQVFPIFCCVSVSVDFTERKPKNKKWGRPGNEATTYLLIVLYPRVAMLSGLSHLQILIEQCSFDQLQATSSLSMQFTYCILKFVEENYTFSMRYILQHWKFCASPKTSWKKWTGRYCKYTSSYHETSLMLSCFICMQQSTQIYAVESGY